MNYLQPDTIWRNFGLKSDVNFIYKLVFKGKFHCLISEKTYNIVKFLKD